jgi:Zn-dependent protease
MFISGFGAMVRLHEYPATPREDAEVGLAGPVWGLGAALACWGAYHAAGSGAWAVIAQLGAWINLFNLLPFWQLDGARGFHALTRGQRWMAVGVVASTMLLSGEDC